MWKTDHLSWKNSILRRDYFLMIDYNDNLLLLKYIVLD